MRGDVDLDATRESVLRLDGGDERIDLLGRSGYHRLAR